jgi:hypothetical protein
MAISNELSGDIAAAILGTRRTSGRNVSDLKETVLRVHSILQELSDKNRNAVATEQPAKTSDTAFDAGQ